MGKNLEPQFTFRCDKKTMDKLGYIANAHTRTRNQEMKYIIKEYIMSYESSHGEIVITEPEIPEIRIPILDPYHLGVKAGEKTADVIINQVKKQKESLKNPTGEAT